MRLPLPSSSSITHTHHPSMSSFPARFPEGTRLLPPNSVSWGTEKLQDQLCLAFTLWETLERQIGRCHDPKDVSKAILQMPNNQQFRLFQRVFPSCWISKHLPPSLSPYYSVRDMEKVCGWKTIYCPQCLLPSLLFPCPRAPGSGSCSPIFGLYRALCGLSHTLRLLGQPSHQPISLGAVVSGEGPNLQGTKEGEGRGAMGHLCRVRIHPGQMHRAGLQAPHAEGRHTEPLLMLQPRCSRCSG